MAGFITNLFSKKSTYDAYERIMCENNVFLICYITEDACIHWHIVTQVTTRYMYDDRGEGRSIPKAAARSRDTILPMAVIMNICAVCSGVRP